MKQIINMNLNIVLIFILIPISIINNLFFIKTNEKSYFKKSENLKCKVIFKDINFFSFKSFLIFVILLPCLLYKYFNKKILFNENLKNKIETPKQISHLISYRLLNHSYLVKKIAEKNNFFYGFFLQPSLFFSTENSPLDKRLTSFAYNKKIDGFHYIDYYKEYYKSINSSFQNHKDLKNYYFDLSQIFSKANGQRYVDPVHFGSIGQNECAKILSDIIIDREKLKK